jgi:hypothetical protein
MPATIFSQSFAVYEKLAAAKMNTLRDNLNAHNHDTSGTSGVQISFLNLSNIIGNITGTMIHANTITGANISDGSIYLNSLYIGGGAVAPATTIHLSTDGYAVYAP